MELYRLIFTIHLTDQSNKETKPVQLVAGVPVVIANYLRKHKITSVDMEWIAPQLIFPIDTADLLKDTPTLEFNTGDFLGDIGKLHEKKLHI
jgi:hypothetical protein